jgi:Predicted ATPases
MIKQVRITNFKSLSDVSVDLEPVTILIGRSGTGKSNFIDALRFLRDCVVSRSGDIASSIQGGWPMIVPATASGQVNVSFLIRFTSPGAS